MSKKTEIAIFFFILTITLTLSLWSPVGNFTATPKYWWDESFTVEIARTFLETGELNLTVAPGTTSQNAITVNANGFPLSLPLAGVYSIFGVGIEQTRIYMLGWIFATTVLLYFFLRAFFDKASALAGTFFVITFASFFANGRTATGDIPGFFLLLLSLWLILHRRAFFYGGILLGLAAVSKISLYHMVFPAIAVTLLLTERKKFIKPLLKTAAGSLIIGIIWILLLFPRPFAISNIIHAINFFSEPYHKLSLLQRMPASLGEIFTSTTFIYFAALMFVLIYAFKKERFSKIQNDLFIFSFSYILLQFYVFLSSPGWNRYLVASELFVLILFFPSLRALIYRYTPKKLISAVPVLLAGAVILLGTMQTIQYIYFSNIFSKPNPSRAADQINQQLASDPGSTVGFINDPMTAALIPGDRKYQIVHVGGNTYAGINPLDNPPEKLPTYMYNFDEEHRDVIEKYYESFELKNNIRLFRKKTQY